MVKLKKLFNALLLAIGVFCFLFAAGLLLGLTENFGELFSIAGFIVMFFLALSVLLD